MVTVKFTTSPMGVEGSRSSWSGAAPVPVVKDGTEREDWAVVTVANGLEVARSMVAAAESPRPELRTKAETSTGSPGSKEPSPSPASVTVTASGRSQAPAASTVRAKLVRFSSARGTIRFCSGQKPSLPFPISGVQP